MPDSRSFIQNLLPEQAGERLDVLVAALADVTRSRTCDGRRIY